MSSRSELEASLREVSRDLDEIRLLAIESPSLNVTLRGLELQRENYLQQLESLGRTQLALHLNGPGVRGEEMDARILGGLLVSLQDTVSALAQTLVAKSTRFGKLPGDLLGATNLSFTSTFAGSVGITLAGAPEASYESRLVDTDSALDASLKVLVEFLNLVEDEATGDDDLIETVLPWGSRAFKHLRDTATVLADGKIETSLDVRDSHGGPVNASLSRKAAERLARVLDRRFLRDEEIRIEGHLGTVSDFRNRVEIVEPSGKITNARVDDSLVASLRDFYARDVVALIATQITREAATGLERTFNTVIELQLKEGASDIT